MKLLVLLGVLVTGVFAKKEELQLTNNCAAEVAKYQECFNDINLEVETKEQVEGVCAAFKSTKCNKFMEDLSKTTYACMSEEEVIYDDINALASILQYKIEYLLLCSKKSDGTLCPVSKLYTENVYDLMVNEQEKITDDQLTVITEDCKINECNERMVTLFSDFNLFIRIMSILTNDYYENDNEPYFIDQLLYGYQIFYGNKKCSAEDIVHDPYENINEMCQKELDQYQECVNDIYQVEFTNANQVNNFCSKFSQAKCQKLLEGMYKTEESACTPRSNMVSEILGEIEKVLEMKLNYLLFCTNDKAGNQCPLTQYSLNNYEELSEEQNEITSEQHEIIMSDCKIDECNERMVALFNNYDEFLAVHSYRYDTDFKYTNDPYFLSQFLYSYQLFYKNKNCDPEDVYHEKTMDFCEYEVELFKECVEEVKDFQLDNEKSIQKYCNTINTSPKCVNFMYDIYNTDLSCYSTESPNVNDFYAGLDYMQNKLNYHLYCSTDKDGNQCPVSKYIVSNYEAATKTQQTELTADQLSIIKEDCLESKCADQRNTLFAIYNNYINVFKALFDKDIDENPFFAFIFLDNYTSYYRERECATTCSEFLNGSRSTECEAEYSKYSKCIDDFRIVDFDTVSSIEYLCSYFEQPKCKSFVKDLTVSDSVCLNTAFDRQNSQNASARVDEASGITIIGLRIQYQTFCGKDAYGNTCPLSWYLQNTFENERYGHGEEELESLTTDQLDVIGEDCRDDKCNARIIAIHETSQYMSQFGYNTSSIFNDDDTMNSYYTNYKEKTCSAIDGYEDTYYGGDDNTDFDFDFGNPSPECEKEFVQFSECLMQISGNQLQSEDEIKKMCAAFNSSQCKYVLDSISSPNSKCLDNMDMANPNVMDYFYGVSIVSYKMQYLMYCSKDSQGNTCPLSQYLIDTVENDYMDEDEEEDIDIKEYDASTLLPPEQLKVIATDCRDLSCNARMVTIGKYYSYLQKMMSSENGMDSEDTLQAFIKNYKAGDCSSIDGSDPSLDSDIINSKMNASDENDNNNNNTIDNEGGIEIILGSLIGQMGNPTEACLAEVSQYQTCLTRISPLMNSMNSKENIESFCSAVEGEVCQTLVANINSYESACISIENPNISDIVSGGSVIAIKAAYQLLCAKDTNGNVCPVSKYVLDHYEELEELEPLDQSTSNITPEQLEVIISDCKIGVCHDRIVAILEFIDNIPILVNKLITSVDTETATMIESTISSYLENELFKAVSTYYKSKNCGVEDGTIGDDNKNSSGASSLKRITFTTMVMVILSSFLLF